MHAEATNLTRPRKLVAQARAVGTCAVCGRELPRRDEPDPPTCTRKRPFEDGLTCTQTYRAVQLARLIAREPGLSRRKLAERLGYSERQVQAMLNWVREAEPEVLVITTTRLARAHGYRFVPVEVLRVEVDGEVLPR